MKDRPPVPFVANVYYGAGNPNNQRIHAIAVVEGQIVVKHWSRRRREWMYEVEHPAWFDLLEQHGSITYRRAS